MDRCTAPVGTAKTAHKWREYLEAGEGAMCFVRSGVIRRLNALQEASIETPVRCFIAHPLLGGYRGHQKLVNGQTPGFPTRQRGVFGVIRGWENRVLRPGKPRVVR